MNLRKLNLPSGYFKLHFALQVIETFYLVFVAAGIHNDEV